MVSNGLLKKLYITNKDICRYCNYNRSPEKLIHALVECWNVRNTWEAKT